MLCLILLAVVPLVFASRKYDIESEAYKLYKEDFDTVLLRFRRTPEYLKILEDRNTEHTLHVNDILNQITFYYLDQQEKKVSEMLGITTPKPNRGDATTTEGSNKESARQGGDAPDQASTQFHSEYNFRRNDKYNKSAVERLDSYSKFQSYLTLDQRNAMKDLGFQFAGDIIHSVIRNLGPDKSSKSDLSTQQPYDDEDKKVTTTTEHVVQHTVAKPESQQEATEPANRDLEGPPPDLPPEAGREGKISAKRQLSDVHKKSPLPVKSPDSNSKKKHAKKKLII